MKVIQITEKRFEEIFKQTLDQLRLDFFKGRKCNCEKIVGRQPMDEMHGQFHYEICLLKDALKDA